MSPASFQETAMSGEQMAVPFHEWAQAVTNDDAEERPDIERLKHRLLEFGGHRFQFDWFLRTLPPELVKLLLDFGKCRSGEGAKLRRGRRNDCHENARRLVIKHGGLRFGTGLALSPDGCWRIHSWCASKRGQVIETTDPRTLYFGIELPREVFDERATEKAQGGSIGKGKR